MAKALALVALAVAHIVAANEPDWGQPAQQHQQQQHVITNQDSPVWDHAQQQAYQQWYTTWDPHTNVHTTTSAAHCPTPSCVSGPSTTVVTATTLITQTVSPGGLPHATTSGVSFGTNGVPTPTWVVVQPSTIIIPATLPASPPCATWAVGYTTTTVVLGTQTLIIKNPTLTAAGPAGSTVTVTHSQPYTNCPTIAPVTITAPASTVTTTKTVTTTVSSVVPPSPACTPDAVPRAWTKQDIYKGTPFVLNYNDPNSYILKVQDAGYKTEQYSIEVDGHRIGTTPAITPDFGAWCGIDLSSVSTCKAQGHGYAEFTIPGGKHTVTITNIPGIYDTADTKYSTMFYTWQLTCGLPPPPKPACAPSLVADYKAIDVRQDTKYELPAFNYNYPVKLTVVDAGYRSEKYFIELDGTRIGQTHSYTKDWNVWCGITADTAQNCLNQHFSTGIFIIPAGHHVVKFENINEANPAWTPWSTAFYKIEAYCE